MRILLIEDDALVARHVSKGMREAGHCVLHADDGLQGLDHALNDAFDIAIIDLMLPSLDGLSIIDRMRERGQRAPVIILSARRTVDDRVAGLRRGGDDYLTKPFSFTELLARVEALARRASGAEGGGAGSAGSELDIADLHLDLLSRQVSRQGRRIDLQPKEFALLEYLVRNAGTVVSKTMIMERVWNYHFDPGSHIVEARISKLREKIDKDFDTPLIHTIRGIGYVLRQSGNFQ